LKLAKDLKQEGNESFKKKNLSKAEDLYLKSLKHLKNNTNDEEAILLKIGIHLNLSMLYCN